MATGASWPQALDTVSDQASENSPDRGKDLGLAKKGDGSWAWTGRKVGGGGEPCPSVPSVPGAHPAGKPWGRSCSGRPAQNSLPSGPGCPGQSCQRLK